MPHPREILLTTFIILTISILTACAEKTGSPRAPNNGYCICPGWQGRLLQQCATPPIDGNFIINIRCDVGDTNGTDLDGNPVCRVNIESSDPSVLTLFPPFVEVHVGPPEDFVFQTNAYLPGVNVSDTVTIFSVYNNVRYDWTTIRVSNSCS